MAKTSRMYGKGQVTVPKAVREQAGIALEDELIVEARGKEIVLRKAPSIFDYTPPRPRREVGLTDRETTDVAWEERVRKRYSAEI